MILVKIIFAAKKKVYNFSMFNCKMFILAQSDIHNHFPAVHLAYSYLFSTSAPELFIFIFTYAALLDVMESDET